MGQCIYEVTSYCSVYYVLLVLLAQAVRVYTVLALTSSLDSILRAYILQVLYLCILSTCVLSTLFEDQLRKRSAQYLQCVIHYSIDPRNYIEYLAIHNYPLGH